ncbi:hypothetical protein [Falsiphaeobacter marinintestinus]|uniref:hypothetical protein n=1 Tax=Falsiphaeobacter marinintestinus TaxID=1492905 RepID=UPI0011B5F558|nr:hypothetical protein [Phaeobacter marinintestinus]
MAQGFSLKDQLFNAEKVRYLAGLFQSAAPEFDANGFSATVMTRLPDLELKQRIVWIAECLGQHLPGPLPDIAPTLVTALPPPLDPTLTDDDFGDFIFAPLGELVVLRGLDDHPDLTLDLLSQITQRFSMEWALRPMLNRWPDLTLAQLHVWTDHPNYHVRRLVSEGTRPRLPWGQGIALDPLVPLALLDRLHADPTRYVTRSIANHLNDIAKSAPDTVIDRLQGWTDEGRQTPAELNWMTRHALRSLVKSGTPRALQVLGYDPVADIQADVTIRTDPVRIGEVLEFECQITAPTDTPVLVDYVLHFQRPGGKVSAKVFKLKQTTAQPGTPLVLTKRHRMKGDATTFQLVPGAHRLEIQINGQVRAATGFMLEPALPT